MTNLNFMKPAPVAVGTPGQNMEIRWAPISSPIALPFTGTSYTAVRAALIKAFGTFPIRLVKDDLPVVSGMVAAGGQDVDTYNILYRALEKYENLELTDC